MDSPVHTPSSQWNDAYAFSEMVMHHDYEALKAYMEDGGCPNLALLVPRTKLDPSVLARGHVKDPGRRFQYAMRNDCGAHPLSYLLTEERFNQTDVHNIYHSGHALLESRRHLLSAIEYTPNHLDLTPSDYAAVSLYAELASDVILDRIKKDGMKDPNRDVFVPFYNRLAILHGQDDMGVFLERAKDVAVHVSHKLRQFLRPVEEEFYLEEYKHDCRAHYTPEEAKRHIQRMQCMIRHIQIAEPTWRTVQDVLLPDVPGDLSDEAWRMEAVIGSYVPGKTDEIKHAGQVRYFARGLAPRI